MNIRFFLLGKKQNSIKRIEKELKYVFAEYLTDNSSVQSYSELKQASASIAKAVENTHAVIFLADPNQYSDTKIMLSKAFGFQLGCDSSLLEKACTTLGKDSEEDYKFSVTHAFVPPKARVFVLDDGTYAGFAVANGNQTIILLPLERERTTVLLTAQVVPYLNATYHSSINMGKLKEYNTGRLADKCIKTGVKIAVAGTNTASFFKDYASSDEKLRDIISISPITEKRGKMPPVDYIVNLSVTAAELLGCSYGAAMSNAFYTGDSPESEKIVYIAISNERETAIREIHSFPGEDIPAFLTRCCADLCAFAVDILSNDAEYIKDVNKKEKALIKKYKAAIITVAAIIGAMTIFCGVFFTMHSYSMKDWYNNFIEWIFPGGNPFLSLGFNEEADENVSFAPERPAKNPAKPVTTTKVFAELQTRVTTTGKEDNEETTAQINIDPEPTTTAERESSAKPSSAVTTEKQENGTDITVPEPQVTAGNENEENNKPENNEENGNNVG